MSIKNPFGLRNGIIISVDDLAEEERGLACDCVCPNCGDKFQARMGNVRIHHFAHSGEGCNEEIAFLKGLYMLMQRYAESHVITLPPLDITWSYYNDAYTKENFWNRINFGSINYGQTIRVNEAKSIKFDNNEIVYDGDRPIALKLSYHSSDLYITIQPPATFCKQSKARSFAPKSYLVLNVSKESFENRTSEEYFSIFAKAMKFWGWGYNSTAIKALDEINKQNAQKVEEYKRQMEAYERERQKILEQEEQLRKQREEQAEKRRKMMESLADKSRRHSSEVFKPTSFNASQPQKHTPPQKTKEETQKELEKGYEEVKTLFNDNNQTDIIRDSFGQRWVQCELCGEIKPDFEFGSYGGNKHVNLGECRKCSMKK